MPTTKQPTHTVKHPPNWRRWRWVVVCVLLVLLAIWYWLPRRYHLAGRFPSYDANCYPCTTGFFVREGETTFALRDWRSGAVRWRVTTAAPQFAGRRRLNGGITRGHLFSVSPDGRVFAAVTPAGTRTRLQVWREDRRVADTLIRDLPPYPPFVRALDSGRVFVWVWGLAACPIVAFDDGREVARGTAPDASSLAPDGKAVLSLTDSGDYLYSPLFVSHGHVEAPQRQRISQHIHYSMGPAGLGAEDSYLASIGSAQFAEGIVMGADGMIVHPLGEPAAPNGWRHLTISPAGRYTVQDNGTATRVFSPIDGDAWQFTVHGRVLGGDATDDGGCALVDYLRARTNLPGPLDAVVRRFPFFQRFVPDPTWECLALYQRPGKLRAILPLIHKNARPYWNDRGTLLPLDGWFPAPDGHSIVAIAEGRRGRECLLFR